MTAFLELRDAAAAAIEAAPAFAGTDTFVYRDRAAPLPTTIARAVNVRLFRTTGAASGIHGGPIDWDTVLQIEIHVRAALDPAAVVDTMLGHVFAAMAGISLQGLAPLEVVNRPEIEWEVRDADAGHVCATFYTRVIHRTQGNTLTPWS